MFRKEQSTFLSVSRLLQPFEVCFRPNILLLFSHQVVSSSLRSIDCSITDSAPSLSPRVCSDSCALSWWCYLTILSSATPFSFCLQSFPASGSFLMSWLFASGGQRVGASTSSSVLPMTIQGWFPLGLTGLISLP